MEGRCVEGFNIPEKTLGIGSYTLRSSIRIIEVQWEKIKLTDLSGKSIDEAITVPAQHRDKFTSQVTLLT